MAKNFQGVKEARPDSRERHVRLKFDIFEGANDLGK